MTKKRSIASRFRVINTVLLILVVTLVALVFAAVITGISRDASANYARFYSIETVEKLSSYLNPELALVKKVARSKAVREWFANEDDEDKKLAAYNEMMNYAEVLQIASLYFGVNESLNEYSVESGATFADFTPFDRLSPDFPHDDWYFYSLESENEYSLNLDVDKISKTRRMWINCKVSDKDKPLGIFCSALQFDHVFKELFGRFDPTSVTGYIIDEFGIVQMDSSDDFDYGVYENVEDFEEEVRPHITDVNTNHEFSAAFTEYLSGVGLITAERREPIVIRLQDGEYISIAPILNTNWTVVILFNSSSLFSITRLTPLIVIMFIAFMLFFIANGSLIKNIVLDPLNKLTVSVSRAGESGTKIYGAVRYDEIGTLAKMIEDMFLKIKSYNLDLLNSTKEREKQALLLETVNSVASALLAAIDDEDFDTMLLSGMRLMAGCIDADTVIIWKRDSTDDKAYYRRRYQWHSETSFRDKSSNKDNIPSKSKDTDTPQWEILLQGGKCMNGPIDAIPLLERKRIGITHMKSLLAIPVHFGGYFWGFVSFEDYKHKRFFADDEVNILRSGSLMMINAINRSSQAATIRKAHERAAVLLDATPLSCTIWNKEMRAFDCNEEAVRLFGLVDKYDFVNKYMEIFPEYQPDMQLSVDKANYLIKKAFEVGRLVFEWVYKRPDGELIPTEVTLVRVNLENEDYVAEYARDLREHRRMMYDIKRRDELLFTVNRVAALLLQAETKGFEEELLRCMGMMARAVDADRVYIWKNYENERRQLCAKLLHVWEGDGAPPMDDSYNEDVIYDRSPEWKERLIGGECVNCLVNSMPDEPRRVHIRKGIKSVFMAPVFLREALWGYVGFDNCSSERVFTDSEEYILRSGSLMISSALLRNDMTLSIHQTAARLEEALLDAQAASKAKTSFLSNMSHEIRTPINAIVGMTAIGKGAGDIERKDYALEKIEGASNHLLGVINDVLDMSKIEAGKFEIHPIKFDFEKMLRKVIDVMSFRIEEKRQKLTIHLDSNIPHMIESDDQRLAQVITNLLSNSVKFTPENEKIRIDAYLEDEDDEICTIKIAVTDTGIGISAEQQKRLFDSFEQAEGSISRRFGGTGLGLAISKHIIESMGGNIFIESELGKGAKFIFNIKAKRSEAHDSFTRKDVKILAIDPCSESREAFVSAAKWIGLSCTAADSLPKNELYDIYFIDALIPGVGALNLTEEIKAANKNAVVIFMMSAVDWNAAEQDAKAAGAAGFIAKPPFPSYIAECIKRYVLALDNAPEGLTEDKYEEIFKDKRLLLAEDVEINQEIVLSMFEPYGIAIDCAANGKIALSMFKGNPDLYDLILMDVQMPEMDGLEATKQIRSIKTPKAADIPIIAMTANVFKEDIEKCMEAGMNDHVGKPFDFGELLEKIKLYLLN